MASSQYILSGQIANLFKLDDQIGQNSSSAYQAQEINIHKLTKFITELHSNTSSRKNQYSPTLAKAYLCDINSQKGKYPPLNELPPVQKQ